MLSRRDLLKSTLAAGAVGAVGSTVFVPLAAKAKAPLAGTQAPGYYRVMVGDVEVTALSDGAAQFPIADLYVNTTPEQARLALANAFQGTPTYLSVNAYLLNFGDRLVLLDAGTSDLMGPALGKLPANIVASGYHPDQIDDVVITHIHPDHTGGLTLAGAKVFPNATVHVPEADKAFWLSAENKANAPEDTKGFFDQAVASIKPYEDSNTLQTYAPDEAAIAGKINSTFRPGHTPGHRALWSESNGEKFVYWGDITLAMLSSLTTRTSPLCLMAIPNWRSSRVKPHLPKQYRKNTLLLAAMSPSRALVTCGKTPPCMTGCQ